MPWRAEVEIKFDSLLCPDTQSEEVDVGTRRTSTVLPNKRLAHMDCAHSFRGTRNYKTLSINKMDRALQRCRFVSSTAEARMHFRFVLHANLFMFLRHRNAFRT